MLGINVIGYHIGKIIMMKIINDDCSIMIIGMYCDELTMDDDCI